LIRPACLSRVLALVVFTVLPLSLSANTAGDEIEYLLETVGDSGCMFIRNGSHHTSEEAEDHLRTKYRTGKNYVNSAEGFIDKLASRSSLSGRPYKIRCEGEREQNAEVWLTERLQEFRSENVTQQ